MTAAQVRSKAVRARIYELRKEKNGFSEIAVMVGLSPATCEKYFRTAVKKDGLPAFDSPDNHRNRAHEMTNPDDVAQVLALAADPLDEKYRELREACKKAGMKPTLVAAIIRRMKSTYAPVVAAAKRLTTKELVEQLEEKTSLVLGCIDEYAVAQAGLKDLSIAANILIEKHQLLTNKPTQILDVTTRMQVNGLLPMMIAEARRRGITVDGTSVRVE